MQDYLGTEAANDQRGVLPRRVRQRGETDGRRPDEPGLAQGANFQRRRLWAAKGNVPCFLVGRQTGVGRLLFRPAAGRKRDFLLANDGPAQRTLAMAAEAHDDLIDGSPLGRRAGERVVFRQCRVAGSRLDANLGGVGRPAVLQRQPHSGRTAVVAKKHVAGRFGEEVEFRRRQVLHVRAPQAVAGCEVQFAGSPGPQLDPALALRQPAEAQRHDVVDA